MSDLLASVIKVHGGMYAWHSASPPVSAALPSLLRQRLGSSIN